MGEEISTVFVKPNIVAFLNYLLYIIPPLGILMSILVILFEKQHRLALFHALQSVLLFFFTILISLLLAITIIGIFLIPLWLLVVFILWLIALIRAYQGEMWKIPYLGDIAENSIRAL